MSLFHPTEKQFESFSLGIWSGGLIFIKKNLSRSFWTDLSNIKEILSPEISNITSCNILLSCCCMFLKILMRKRNLTILPFYYLENEKVSTFYCSLFEYGAISLINKPTRIAKKPATIIDNVSTTNTFDES